LSANEQAPLNRFVSILKDISDFSDLDDGHAITVVNNTLTAVHDLFDVLPTDEKPPIVFGVALPSVLTNIHQNQFVILGYHLVDPTIGNRPPTVTVAGEAIDSHVIAADFGKVVVQLPDSLIQKLGYKNSACNPLRPFDVRAKVFFPSSGLARVLRITSEADYAVSIRPPSMFYDVSVEATGDPSSTPRRVIPFSAISQYVAVGCDQTVSATVSWSIPPNSRILDSRTRWIETDNVRNTTQAITQNGTAILAFGTISGLDKQCALFGICNCPGGGHGRLFLEGTAASTVPPDFTTQQTARGGAEIEVKMPPNEEWTLRRMTVRAARKGCSTELDRIDLQNPDPRVAAQGLSSLKGIFRLRITDGILVITLAKEAP